MVKVFAMMVEVTKATIVVIQHISLIIALYPTVMVKGAVTHHCCEGRRDKEGKRKEMRGR
jgi:hypothetical protein